MKNLTPHPLDFVKCENPVYDPQTESLLAAPEDVQRIITVKPEGIARIETALIEGRPGIPSEMVEDLGIPVMSVHMGGVYGIPDDSDDPVIIVSLPTALMMKAQGYDMSKIYVPGRVIRNIKDTRQILGCIELHKV